MRYLKRVLYVVAAVAAAHTSFAEMVIKLKDGKTISLPIEANDIAEITFGAAPGASGMKSGAAKIEAPPAQKIGNNKASARSGTLSQGTTYQIGPGQLYEKPSDLVRIAKDGDTIEIEAGVYENDFATWRQNNLTLKGVNGLAHLKATVNIPNGKAIWVINGDNVVVENIEFSGARVRHTNGAGIRIQGGRLTIRDSYFHDNEIGILGGKPHSEVLIERSEFANHKRRKRHSHGIYIGKAASFILRYSYIHGTDLGHQVKSRADTTYILYNRISDDEQGNSSYLVDLSNCGRGFIIGNVLQQGKNTSNYNAISYGAEGCAGKQKGLFVVNNTFVNDRNEGNLINNHSLTPAYLINNIIFGSTNPVKGPSKLQNNLIGKDPKFTNKSNYEYRPMPGSPAIDKAIDPGAVDGISLVPTSEYLHPRNGKPRNTINALDLGAYEAVSER